MRSFFATFVGNRADGSGPNGLVIYFETFCERQAERSIHPDARHLFATHMCKVSIGNDVTVFLHSASAATVAMPTLKVTHFELSTDLPKVATRETTRRQL